MSALNADAIDEESDDIQRIDISMYAERWMPSYKLGIPCSRIANPAGQSKSTGDDAFMSDN
jgi:hypothetical protein